MELTKFISKLKKGLKKTTQTVVRISGEALDYTKIKIKISDIESELDDRYMAIGLAIYEDSETTDVDAICAEITELREELAELKSQLNEFKCQKTCPECGKTTDKENPYCPSCGNKF